MPPKYLEDRYDVDSIRLKPETSDSDLFIVEALASIGIQGTVFHVLEVVPEQAEDLYIVLVDSRLVVRFERPRGDHSAAPKAVKIWFLAEYRRAIGQGRRRILLDRAADAAHEIVRRRISN